MKPYKLITIGLVLLLGTCFTFPVDARVVREGDIIDIHAIADLQERQEFIDFARMVGFPVIPFGLATEGYLIARDLDTQEVIGGLYYNCLPRKHNSVAEVSLVLIVHPSYRNKNIGRKLFEEFTGIMQSDGIEYFNFTAKSETVGFWRKMGAKVIYGIPPYGYIMRYQINHETS